MRNRIALIVGVFTLIFVALAAQQQPAAPTLTAPQQAALTAMNTAVAPLNAALTAARTALTAASLAQPRNDQDIQAKANAVAAAEFAVANARADGVGQIQSAGPRLAAAQLLAAVNPAPAGRGGGGGGALAAPTVTNPNGVRIFIRAGLKSHAEGQHDYPQFLADWSKLLTARGARVDGGLHMPTAQQYAETDVVIFYKGDAGYMTDQEKADLDAYVKRGGGVVSFHDSLCGPDPVYFSTIFGGAKKHGETNFSQGMLSYTIVDKTDPIMKGVSDFTINEEAFMLMTWAPTPIHVLASVPMPNGAHAGEVVPQIWTYEHTVPGGQPARSFAWMQGHYYIDFADPRIQPMLLRGIAWAAKKPIDTLDKAVASQGGRGVGGSDIVVP